MNRTNYYGVILTNGYLDSVYTTRKEAEDCAAKINKGDYSGPDYQTYSAEVIRGIKNIQKRTKGKFSEQEIKERL